ncbi:Bug family tripartite tricarboxylate transporter substrate binding protein [Sabulicella rubraurantiaca]|uniref:Bug family tripartite tricarboxylate transporter substrate binding protein n=1 Tax=Sabulicella rubraurantiaca TaxID=2811429 RepID=UPI001A9612C6|nr:tripartite tricarboxylate transporter substrate binding protein [Sabulicella rubraurantiaca]
MTRRAFLLGGLTPLLASPGISALAQDLPTRPVRLVVPYAPGGTTDILARILAEHFQAEFGQPLVVDLRPGAGGTVGTAQVAQAAPDGTTLVMGTPGTHATAKALYPNLTYDPIRDFAPVTLVANVPNIVVVNPSLPVRSIAELIAAARARPGSINYGSAGNGATTHLSGELFRLMTDAQIVHIPYRGSGAALIDLQAGQIQLMFENLPGAIQHVRDGRLRALAVTSPWRAKATPDLPTVSEAGVPGYGVVSWFALFAPAATPAPLVARLNQGFRRIMAIPSVRQRMEDLGAEPADGPPEELGRLVAEETTRWTRVIQDAQIRIQ